MAVTLSLFDALEANQRRTQPMRVSIEGHEATAVSPEGKRARMPLDALLDRVTPESLSTGEVILPHGIRTVTSGPGATIWVYESPPRVHTFDWIADDSPMQFGKGTTYRKVRLALPYLIVLVVFERRGKNQWQLSSCNECFFRSSPLKSLEDDLCYPALLNCSKFSAPEGKPLSWICTQHLKMTPEMSGSDPNQQLRAGFEALRHCLLETGFNRSSEMHEGSSWFEESRKVDERISTVDAWQEASRDPLFVLEVPWLRTGFSVRGVLDRILQRYQARKKRVDNASALGRIIFNHPQPKG